MYFFVYAALAAGLTYVGLLLSKVGHGSAIRWAVLFGLVMGCIGWLFMPVLAWNFYGNWLLLAMLGFGLLVAASVSKEEFSIPGAVALVVAIVMICFVAPATSWGILHADRHRALIGMVTTSDFNADVSPINIRQVRRVDQKLAKILGEKRIEEMPGLGSRVDLDRLNIQVVNGCFGVKDGNGKEHELCFENQLMWAGPLVHEGIFKYWANGTTPGYIMVSATDPSDVYLVTAIKGANGTYEPLRLRYLNDGGYFGDYVRRHLRLNGYVSAGLTDYTFEIDNHGRPHWVITRYERTIGFDGENAVGVLAVDIQTGVIKEYSIENAPSWIDRIQPESMVTEQLDSWGWYVHGFWNTIFGKRDVVKTTPGMSLVYGSDGKSYWYTGMQSAGGDQSSNSFVLIDTRTKTTRRYMIAGANETAAQRQAEAHPQAKPSNLSGTFPILYNVGGAPTYFVTLKGSSGVVQLYAFVNMQNYEVVGVGRDVQAALRDYQNALVQRGGSVRVDDIVNRKRIEAVVVAAVKDGEFFYLRLQGQDGREFYGTSAVSPELKWTGMGNRVTIEVDEGESVSIPILRFDNMELSLSSIN